jgi:hypothetical protein
VRSSDGYLGVSIIDAYTGEFVEFTAAVRECRAPSVTG